MRIKLSNFILFFGYLFLYAPLLCIAVYSFNESAFASAWSGFSLKWYKMLMSDQIMLRATYTSLKIAGISATASVIIGTIAAIVIARLPGFRGKSLFKGAITAPLVMPEVVMGLSLLMLFMGTEKYFGWPDGRSTLTVVIAHITLTLSYVTMVVQARLQDLDRSIEEAAMDLGASPLKAFFVITLPMISPSIMVGWLLAFALSLDDVIIASFVAGPGATTLPMIVFSSLRFGISPEINALATILMTVLTIGVIISAVWIYKGKDARESA
ncbi:MAG: ABC transporter permease subunit [Holosporaceae bacterium]|jgi:putrescine transport system permease protein|nr:ABC transporter permease subunit [Holosporaceae bacterium]